MVLASTALILMLTVPADLPTAPFRTEHVEIKEHLSHIDAMAGTLAASKPQEQRKTMAFIAQFLDEHIRKHAEWEEAHLYPAVDLRTHAGIHPFTSSMRYEHRIVGRSIDELSQMAKAEKLDAAAFTRGTHRLLGLISAHFEEEEEVLLPILDRTMTKEEFEKEISPSKEH